MTLKVHGIGACDTCRKARKWLEEQGIAHEWRDLRKEPVPVRDLAAWLKAVGPQRLVNKRSTTWRQLPEGRRPALEADDLADVLADVLADHPTLVKRPLFERDGEVRVGFDAEVRQWASRN
ncbi:MAG: Spx/MgsR family RNA polymerase-binding regulatory protein [Candidatus Wenzhouxiangella sp. M2_3B_020]